MSDSRREFLKKAALLSGGMGVWSMLPPALKMAMAINPEVGSTFYDAEHVVLLMQENRSFDHCFGSLQGVRGFNDPRAIDLPSGNKVWLQESRQGETYAPFRLNMRDTQATWMGGLPHSWENQVDARNKGKYDQWLIAKQPGHKDFKDMPLTLGYYNREDIPFYYAFADAFTVCDQHFCSSLTGTTSNRMFFWSGTIKDKPGGPAWVRNSDIGYRKEVNWKTFPERLQEHGIGWKVYQNELSITTDLAGEEESLLANFTNNNLEWFSQYNVRFSNGHYKYLLGRQKSLLNAIEKLQRDQSATADEEREKLLSENREKLKAVEEEIERWSPENYQRLSARERDLHERGLCINSDDPDYHTTEEISYADQQGVQRSLRVPKGDLFHEFRKDVKQGKLPTVSWLVAPEYFSDHPSAPWYGAWYVSEALDILTENPEIWKKTIFILNYDENDGYFDHIPPFVAPNPADPDTGRTSSSMDSADEYVTLQQELSKAGMNPQYARESPVGLGYRVPLIVASPWSRGGWVNSQVCDITSTLLFLEKFLNKKFGVNIKEENINSWRRAICGDLTSVFRPYEGQKIELPAPVQRDGFMKEIHDARFKQLPSGFKALSPEEIEMINQNPDRSPFFPKQEEGIRDANPLPYYLEVREDLSRKEGVLHLNFSSLSVNGQSAGVPFSVYAPGRYLQKKDDGTLAFMPVKVWDFAVGESETLTYSWPVDHFQQGVYHLRVHGPNGYLREFKGEPANTLEVHLIEERKAGSADAALRVLLRNSHATEACQYRVEHRIYGSQDMEGSLKPLEEKEIVIPVNESFNWYEISVLQPGSPNFLRKAAGRIETGYPGKTDPQMGRVLK